MNAMSSSPFALLARLDGEIGLGLGDNFLSGISILCDEVTGIAREPIVIDFAFGSLAGLDHSDIALPLFSHAVLARSIAAVKLR